MTGNFSYIKISIFRLETNENLNEKVKAKVMKKKPPRTEIIYDKPPEDENPPEYPYVHDPKKATIGIVF